MTQSTDVPALLLLLVLFFSKVAGAAASSLFLTSGAVGLRGASSWRTVPAFVLVRAEHWGLGGNPCAEDWQRGARRPLT